MPFNYVALAVAFCATLVLAKYHPLSDEYIAEINRKQTTWKAGRNFEMSQWDHFKRISSGTVFNRAILSKLKQTSHDERQSIPDNYDARKAYPDCPSISDIYDQANCGSCWAFCAVEAMSDRICIKSGQRIKSRVSAQDGLECCANCGNCNSGDSFNLYKYWATNGIVTGGHYNKLDEGCKPYFLPECGTNCPSETASVPACSSQCANSSLNYEEELTFAASDLYVMRNESQILLEILNNGPVSAIFLIPADFGNYKSGIYQHTTDVIVGSHCVKLIGWGRENGIKYWIVSNSWGKDWGESGYFRIIRGRNESGIEGAVASALPKLDLTFNAE